MQPEPNDTSIQIPVTFDYRGGRNENRKNKVIVTVVALVLATIVVVGVARNRDMDAVRRVLIIGGVLYGVLLLLRFFVFHELRFSDIYEGMLLTDFQIPTTAIWKIFDIDYEYPHICYYKNGVKGIFVRMEKSAVTGKGDNACFDHYEAISEAYNRAHSLNMNIRHIDYMDNIGNDPRLQALYDNLDEVENEDMERMLIDIYDNLQEQMSMNYASYDIYLFLSRDRTDNFINNVQQVCNAMLGGNFITYRVLGREDLRSVCMALFNIHDFSVVRACEENLKGEESVGVVPIRIIHADGTVEKLNKTQEEKRIEREIQQHEAEEKKIRAKERKRSKKQKEPEQGIDEDLDLF